MAQVQDAKLLLWFFGEKESTPQILSDDEYPRRFVKDGGGEYDFSERGLWVPNKTWELKGAYWHSQHVRSKHKRRVGTGADVGIRDSFFARGLC